MSTGSCAARRSSRWRAASPYLLAGLLTASGIGHFVATDTYASIVPRALPGPRTLVYLSGVAELGCAAALLVPRSCRAGAWATAVLFVAVFPANVEMALDRGGHSAAYDALTLARLPLQLPLIWWAVVIARQRLAGAAEAEAG